MFSRTILFAVALTVFAQGVNAAGINKVYSRDDGSRSFSKWFASAVGLRSDPKNIAVVIGVSRYEDDRAFQDLSAARNDAKRFAEHLYHEQKFDYVHLLTEDAVTLETIRKIMITDMPKLIDKDDRFLFYWSGHGTQRQNIREGWQGYLVLPNSKGDHWHQMLAMNALQQWDQNISASQVLYVLDACFSGYAFAEPKNDRVQKETLKEMALRSRELFTAGTRDDQTIAVEALGGSVFTTALIDGLSGRADRSEFGKKDNIVSLSELESYVKARVRLERLKAGWEKKITPRVRDIALNEGEFFFSSLAVANEKPDPASSLQAVRRDPSKVVAKSAGETEARQAVRKKGLYLTSNLRKGSRVTTSHLRAEAGHPDEPFVADEAPLEFDAEILGTCLDVDVSEGTRLEWRHLSIKCPN